MLFDPRVPLLQKLIPVAALLYLISPFDLRPDFILGLGLIDDLLITIILLTLFIVLSPKEAIADSLKRTDKTGTEQHDEQHNTIEGSARRLDEDTKTE